MSKLPAADKWLVRSAYQNGDSIQAIACQFSLPEETVRKAIGNRPKPAPAHRPPPPPVLRVTLVTYDPDWQKALIDKIRTTPLYKDWRKAVLRNDKYRCRECGNTKGIHVDHIYPLSAIIHNYRINSLEEAAECELLWRVSNGRTLCNVCHQRTDTHGAKARRYWLQYNELK